MSDLPSWLVAAGTFTLAAATVWLGLQTRSAVQAAAREASSTADLVAETRRDRELEFRPYIVWGLGSYTSSGEGVIKMDASPTRNIGRGPALSVLLTLYWPAPGRWFISALGDLPPAGSGDLAMNPEPGPNPVEDVFGTTESSKPHPWRAAFCQDQLGITYRFLPGHSDVAVWPRETRDDLPGWVSWYRSRLPR